MYGGAVQEVRSQLYSVPQHNPHNPHNPNNPNNPHNPNNPNKVVQRELIGRSQECVETTHKSERKKLQRKSSDEVNTDVVPEGEKVAIRRKERNLQR